MPFRALIWSVVTVALALLALGMWVRAVEPYYRVSQVASTQAVTAVATTVPQHQAMVAFMRGVLLLGFLLIVVLFAIGVVISLREWVRYVPGVRKRVRTEYVDAWKVAGERLEAGEKEEE